MDLLSIYHNDSILLRASREGITKDLFLQIVQSTGLTIGGFTQMAHLTAKTLQRKKPDEKISPESSERAILIGKLYHRGEVVFGNKEKFHSWMNKNLSSLDGRKPKELLDTITGISMVEDELIRIEHGIVA